MDRKVIAAVLAAGASTRFGSAKQLAVFNGQTLIEHVQSVLLSSSADEVIVLLGCNREALKEHILPGAHFINNDSWEEGIASSIRKAVQHALSKDASHLLLLVCDQPYVSTCLIDKIISVSKFEPQNIIASRYGEAVGVPALFPRRCFDELSDLKGDTGAKSIIKRSKNVELVEFPQGLLDIDCPSDMPETGVMSVDSAK